MRNDRPLAEVLTLDDLAELVASQRSEEDCLRECFDDLSQDQFEDLGNGHLSANDTLGIFEIRYRTTQLGGLATKGFAKTLENLSTLPPDENVILKHLKLSDRTCAIFVSAVTNQLVECICVMA
jgi:hypothetical protein